MHLVLRRVAAHGVLVVQVEGLRLAHHERVRVALAHAVHAREVLHSQRQRRVLVPGLVRELVAQVELLARAQRVHAHHRVERLRVLQLVHRALLAPLRARRAALRPRHHVALRKARAQQEQLLRLAGHHRVDAAHRALRVEAAHRVHVEDALHLVAGRRQRRELVAHLQVLRRRRVGHVHHDREARRAVQHRRLEHAAVQRVLLQARARALHQVHLVLRRVAADVEHLRLVRHEPAVREALQRLHRQLAGLHHLQAQVLVALPVAGVAAEPVARVHVLARLLREAQRRLALVAVRRARHHRRATVRLGGDHRVGQAAAEADAV